ncbi:hypothetical protein OIDMADRAFT_45105 [Oidiodendron maius Zn]|uniref:Cytochrome P450 n=1 Tax=Oidiodendron maius (strain Zn) TaxID=913774 RepID=A0A0C3GX14_OIDMZ|nr:hypothetical protein OIDMADRAFT_45105 [Oidiodendron maius Zn]
MRAFSAPNLTMLSSLPGPWISQYTDLVLKYHWVTGNRAHYVHRLHQKYGPIVRVAPTEVDFSDVSAAKEIHRVGSGFVKSDFYQKQTNGASSVFSITDPKKHSARRRLLSAPMSDSSLKSMESLINEKITLAIQRIKEEMELRGSADVFKWWLFMASDVIGQLTFGDSFKNLDRGVENQYFSDMKKVGSIGALNTSFPVIVKLSRTIPLPFFASITSASKRLVIYAEQSLERYKKLLDADPTHPPPTLFTKLFQAGEEGLPNDVLKDEARGYIIAGSDTTAVSLTYLVWAVCSDEKIKATLIEELGSLPENFQDQDTRNLVYLNQVIDETLRVYSAAPSALPRTVPPGGAVLAGKHIPGGVTATTQAYSLHRNQDVFPDPERFNPTRWVAPTKDMKDAFMPFGGGSRICLGMHLARMELRMAAALFFRTFPHARVSNLEGMSDADMAEKIYFLLSPKGKRCLIRAS